MAMRDGSTRATFTVTGVGAARSAEGLGEDRSLPVQQGRFTDAFDGYGVHLYRLR